MNYFLTTDAAQLLRAAGPTCFGPEHRGLFFGPHGPLEVSLDQLEETNPQLCGFVEANPPQGEEIDRLFVLRYLGSEKHLRFSLGRSRWPVLNLRDQIIRLTERDHPRFFFADLLMSARLTQIDGWLATAESGPIRFENLVISPNLEVAVGDEVLLHWGVVVERVDRVANLGWTVERVDRFLTDNLPDFHQGRWQDWKPSQLLSIDFRNLGGFNFAKLNEGRLYE